MQNIEDMGIPKIIVISARDACKAQITNWQANDAGKKVISGVLSVVEIILRTTKDLRSAMISKRRLAHLSVWNSTLLPLKSNLLACKLKQEYRMFK
jgi:hypothetical protein